MKTTSSDSESVSATASTTAKAGSYKVTVTDVPKAVSESISAADLANLAGQTIKINNQEFTLKSGTAKEIANDLNDQLKAKGIKATATYTELYNDGNNNYGGMIIKADSAGADENLLKVTTNDDRPVAGFSRQPGKNSTVTIKDLKTGAERVYENATNQIEVDGITFNISENATSGSSTTITTEADSSKLKEKLTDFVKDYNELMGAINTKLYETRDKSYMPLTDEDKEGLSDSEIEKLEKKAQEGLLRNDSYLSAFADDMILSMATVMKQSFGGSSAGLSLEKIGIKPVNNYTTQNGLLEIVDEEKLQKALDENIDGVKELFTRRMANTTSSESDGVFTKLSKNLKDHATSRFSKLANRAGVASGVTAETNEMTKDINQRKKLIAQMQAALKEKEDALYSRYSTLESNLASLQSQQSSLSSYFA